MLSLDLLKSTKKVKHKPFIVVGTAYKELFKKKLNSWSQQSQRTKKDSFKTRTCSYSAALREGYGNRPLQNVFSDLTGSEREVTEGPQELRFKYN